MIETREREIGERRFFVTQIPGMRSVKLINKLGRIAGPALASIAGGTKSGLGDMELSKLGDAAQMLFSNLPDSELESIIKELLQSAEFSGSDGKRGRVLDHFDLMFAGNQLELFKLLAFALEVNFGNFLDAIKGRLQSVPALKV